MRGSASRKPQKKNHSGGSRRQRKTDDAKYTGSYAVILKNLLLQRDQKTGSAIGPPASLVHLDYAAELAVKGEGLGVFWERNRLPGRPEQIVASPKPRWYRTASNRRALLRGTSLYLFLGEKATVTGKRKPFTSSPLEPKEHAHIYRLLQKKLSDPFYRLVTSHLNSLTIRGSYAEQAVIFSVDMLNGPLVRKLKILAGQLQKEQAPIAAAFVCLDPGGSDHYVEGRQTAGSLAVKRLFGPEHLTVALDDYRYRFHPATPFSPVNESMIPLMLGKVRELVAPDAGQVLVDLYCGYGLFSHFLAPAYTQVLGVEAEAVAIELARANAHLNKRRGGKTRFLSRRITESLIENELPEPTAPETVLLDPPRQGPAPGVIKAVCGRQPHSVLHIFCGVDQVPAACREWQENGYKVQRIVPLDMFPGVANLEVLILLRARR